MKNIQSNLNFKDLDNNQLDKIWIKSLKRGVFLVLIYTISFCHDKTLICVNDNIHMWMISVTLSGKTQINLRKKCFSNLFILSNIALEIHSDKIYIPKEGSHIWRFLVEFKNIKHTLRFLKYV